MDFSEATSEETGRRGKQEGDGRAVMLFFVWLVSIAEMIIVLWMNGNKMPMSGLKTCILSQT